MKKLFLFFCLCFISCNDLIVDTDYSNDSLSVISITIKPEHYTELLENKLKDAFVPADLYYNNKSYKVHLSPQGAGSRFYPKFGLKVTLSDGLIAGLKEFNLSTQVSDNTLIRSQLASHLYKQFGFLSFYSEVIFLKINNEDKGLFLLTEKIDEDFFQRRNKKVFELVKTVFDAKFTFMDKNNPEATFEKKIPDDNNFSNLSEFIHLIDTIDITKNTNSLEKLLDVDNYIKYHALTSIMNNTDGLANNFYFYKERGNSPYVIIPWDFDKSFNLQFKVGVVGNNHIIKKILENENYRKRYNDIVMLIVEKYFTEENLFPIIDSCFQKFKKFYNRDPFLYNEQESFETRVRLLKDFIISQREIIKHEKI